MNVDLGRRVGPGRYELIELKAGQHAETPLKAAYEIVSYGLLYCFARINQSALELPREHELLRARRIDLKVLAPRSVYSNYRVEGLADRLDLGLQQFSKRKFSGQLLLTFSFEAFPQNFVWPGASPAKLRSALKERMRYRF